MSTFELRYPSGGPYSQSWLPSVDPATQGSALEEVSGIVADRMADAFQQYGYRISDPFTIYTYAFLDLTDTDRSNLVAFMAVVGAGAFDFKEGTCGLITSYKKVVFAPENMRRQWARRAANKFAATVVLVDSD